VHVEVIVTGNQENERLDLNLLESKGAYVYKIMNIEHDGINQKILFNRQTLSKVGAATIHPTNMKIIRLFRTHSLKESKVGRFELKPCASSNEEAEKTILDVLHIDKIDNL